MSRFEANYTTAILCMTVTFLFADQNLLAPNLSAIARDFGFSDAQRDALLGGQIALGFFVIGGTVSVVVGYFADIFPRCLIFGWVVVLGETACLATYFTRTYEQLFVCRILSGISIGGATPVIFSLLADFYPRTSRVCVSTFVGIAMSGGIALGQLLAGLIGPKYGWRLPFLIVAIPSLLCAVLILTTTREPLRGDQENEVRVLRATTKTVSYTQTLPSDTPKDEIIEREHTPPTLLTTISSTRITASLGHPYSELAAPASVAYSEKIDCSKIMNLMQTQTVLLIFMQGLPGCLPWGMIYTFLNDYFSYNRGMTVATATAALTVFGAGGFFGQIFGGMAGQWLYNIDKRLQCVLMGSSTMLSVFPMWYILNTQQPGDGPFFVVAFLGGILVNMNGPNVRTVLQNVCTPETRGSAFALFNLTDDLGKGAGPALVVLLVKGLNGSRQTAFNVVTVFWIVCGILLLLTTQTVCRDEEAVQVHVRNSMQLQRDVLQSHFEREQTDATEEGVERPHQQSRPRSASSRSAAGPFIIPIDSSPLVTTHTGAEDLTPSWWRSSRHRKFGYQQAAQHTTSTSSVVLGRDECGEAGGHLSIVEELRLQMARDAQSISPAAAYIVDTLALSCSVSTENDKSEDQEGQRQGPVWRGTPAVPQHYEQLDAPTEAVAKTDTSSVKTTAKETGSGAGTEQVGIERARAGGSAHHSDCIDAQHWSGRRPSSMNEIASDLTAADMNLDSISHGASSGSTGLPDDSTFNPLTVALMAEKHICEHATVQESTGSKQSSSPTSNVLRPEPEPTACKWDEIKLESTN